MISKHFLEHGICYFLNPRDFYYVSV
jgi:hypothetical protein